MSPPLPNPPPDLIFWKDKAQAEGRREPWKKCVTAGPYPQPGKSLIYNPTQETTGKQQEVIFKEPVATGSECRGSKHVPIKVRQLQKNHKGSGHGWGRGVRGGGAGGGKHQAGSSCPAERKTWQLCVAQQGAEGKKKQKTALPELAFLSASQSGGPAGETARENPRWWKEKHSH